MKLNSRETTLLIAFLSLLGLFVGGGLIWAGIRSLSGLMEGNEALASRVVALQSAVDNRSIWESRDQWLNEHTETFQTREDASASLLNHIDVCAQEAGMELLGREIVEVNAGEDDAAEPETGLYFRTATIRVKVAGTQESVLGWIHSLQQPEKLIGVTGEVIDAGEEFSAEIEVTKSYFEGES
jgi:hypothetical protein